MKRTLKVLALLLFVFVLISALVAILLDCDLMRSGEQVGVVYIEGPIFSSEDIIDELKDFEDDDAIKGLILRIDSPGGAVAPSQEIFAVVSRIAEEKPVVASMGTMAASGGYYIAAPCTRIVANPGTVTGSIGVIIEIPNVEGLLDKIGLKSEVIKSGEFKDMGSSIKGMSDRDRKLFQSLIDDVYEQFVQDVSESRAIPVDKVKELADGRIYTGRQAHELGLVDELGGMERAIEVVAELAEIEGEPELVTFKKDKGLLDLIRGSVSENISEIFPHIRLKYIMNP